MDMTEDTPPDTQVMPREDPTPGESRESLVTELCDWVRNAKEHWAPTFKRMRDDMRFAAGWQWPGQTADDDRYVANLVHRHIQQRVAALYAKNPRAVAKRRPRLDFSLWDENPQTLMVAQQAAQMGDPNAVLLVQDAMRGMASRMQQNKIAKTLELLYDYEIANQPVPFKGQMKQAVRRALTTSVAYVKLGYERQLGLSADAVDRVNNLRDRLAHLEALSADMADGERSEIDAEAEEIRLILQDLDSNPDQITHEGLVFDYPRPTSIILDPKVRQLKGFVGARRIAQEYLLTPDDVKAIYKVDVGDSAKRYEPLNRGALYSSGCKRNDAGDFVVVWDVYDKDAGLVYTVCDGYPDFLFEPAAPPVTLERFWPIFVLTFNDIESEEDIFPPSDVSLLRPMQQEYNRSRQGLREHRHANRPMTASPDGMLDDQDLDLLKNRPANAHIQLKGLQPGQKVADLIQKVALTNIDPNLYETAHLFDDILKSVGSQETAFGGVSGGTATEVSVAESARSAAMGSAVDELDDFLTELSRAAGFVLLTEMDEGTVKRVVGPGAVWPQLTNAEAAEEIFLEIKAGSSGRPNQVQDLQNMERVMPFLLQIPGIDPKWLAEQILMRLDDRLDLTEALAAGLPSMVAMNSQTQASTGDPATSPETQGAQGAQNARPARGRPTPKAAPVASP